MPVVHKSTIRRARQAVKRHDRNRATLGALKSLVKKVQSAVAEKKVEDRSGIPASGHFGSRQGRDEGCNETKYGFASDCSPDAPCQLLVRFPLVIVRTFEMVLALIGCANSAPRPGEGRSVC